MVSKTGRKTLPEGLGANTHLRYCGNRHSAAATPRRDTMNVGQSDRDNSDARYKRAIFQFQDMFWMPLAGMVAPYHKATRRSY